MKLFLIIIIIFFLMVALAQIEGIRSEWQSEDRVVSAWTLAWSIVVVAWALALLPAASW